jgi:MFS family permease
VIIIGLAVVEIFWSMSNIGWSALISDIFPGQKRNEIMGYLTSIGGLGRFAGIWIGGALYDGFGKMYEGWGFHSGVLFFIAAGVMIISMIPVRYLPEGGIRKEEVVSLDCNEDCQSATIRLFWVFLVAMVFINFGRNSVIIVQSQYLVLDTGFGVSSRMLSYIYNTESAAIVIFGLLAGRIGRWIGDGRSVCLGAVAAIAYLVLFSFADHVNLIFVGSLFRGIAEVIIMAASYALASVLIPPERRGRLFGVFNATLFLSWGIGGTLISGPIIDGLIHNGFAEVLAYRAAYLAGLLLVAVGLIIQSVLVFILIPRAGIPGTILHR